MSIWFLPFWYYIKIAPTIKWLMENINVTNGQNKILFLNPQNITSIAMSA